MRNKNKKKQMDVSKGTSMLNKKIHSKKQKQEAEAIQVVLSNKERL
jgi:hypothetical protein